MVMARPIWDLKVWDSTEGAGEEEDSGEAMEVSVSVRPVAALWWQPYVNQISLERCV